MKANKCKDLTDSQHICPLCQKPFSTKRKLSTHVTYCRKVLSTKSTDDAPILIEGDQFKCMECSLGPFDLTGLRRHVTRKHGKECLDRFKSDPDNPLYSEPFASSASSTEGPKRSSRFPCSVCEDGTTFRSIEKYHLHMHDVHNNDCKPDVFYLRSREEFDTWNSQQNHDYIVTKTCKRLLGRHNGLQILKRTTYCCSRHKHRADRTYAHKDQQCFARVYLDEIEVSDDGVSQSSFMIALADMVDNVPSQTTTPADEEDDEATDTAAAIDAPESPTTTSSVATAMCTEEDIQADTTGGSDDVAPILSSSPSGKKTRVFVVTHFPYHTHEYQASKVRLPQEVRSFIMGMCYEGHDISTIIGACEDRFPKGREAAFSYQTVRYLFSRIRASREPHYHRNDLDSVHRMCYLGDNSIIFLKVAGEKYPRFPEDSFQEWKERDERGEALTLAPLDEIVIFQSRDQLDRLKKYCRGVNSQLFLDATHGTNTYRHYLSTLLIREPVPGKKTVAKNRSYRGAPIGHMIHKEDNAQAAEFFIRFAVMKHVAKPKYIHTDDATCYRLALANLGITQLLCGFHVAKCWVENINKHVIHKARPSITEREARNKQLMQRRHQIFLHLRNRLLRARSKEDFEESKRDFLSTYSEEESLIEYLHKSYFNRVEAWAFYVRCPWDATATNILESFHNNFKRLYSNMKGFKARTDAVLKNLVRYDQRLASRLHRETQLCEQWGLVESPLAIAIASPASSSTPSAPDAGEEDEETADDTTEEAFNPDAQSNTASSNTTLVSVGPSSLLDDDDDLLDAEEGEEEGDVPSLSDRAKKDSAADLTKAIADEISDLERPLPPLIHRQLNEILYNLKAHKKCQAFLEKSNLQCAAFTGSTNSVERASGLRYEGTYGKGSFYRRRGKRKHVANPRSELLGSGGNINCNFYFSEDRGLHRAPTMTAIETDNAAVTAATSQTHQGETRFHSASNRKGRSRLFGKNLSASTETQRSSRRRRAATTCNRSSSTNTTYSSATNTVVATTISRSSSTAPAIPVPSTTCAAVQAASDDAVNAMQSHRNIQSLISDLANATSHLPRSQRIIEQGIFQTIAHGSNTEGPHVPGYPSLLINNPQVAAMSEYERNAWLRQYMSRQHPPPQPPASPQPPVTTPALLSLLGPVPRSFPHHSIPVGQSLPLPPHLLQQFNNSPRQSH